MPTLVIIIAALALGWLAHARLARWQRIRRFNTPGDDVVLACWRDGKRHEFTVEQVKVAQARAAKRRAR